MTSYVVGALALASGIVAATAPDGSQASHTTRHETRAYVAHLHPLNTKVTGMQSMGEARFTVKGDSLTISVDAQHVPPAMEHLQHFHGFTTSGRNATCPTKAADKNRDGIIDLIETEPTSGTTMVPFTDDPVSMQIAVNTYPKASADGSYHYEKTVSLSALDSAFAKQFEGQKLDLTHRVVFIHGVPSTTHLPASVRSLGTIPAQVTIPIACGKIEQSSK
jgi:hypothetical protein